MMAAAESPLVGLTLAAVAVVLAQQEYLQHVLLVMRVMEAQE
jgi:hypothetical protein